MKYEVLTDRKKKYITHLWVRMMGNCNRWAISSCLKMVGSSWWPSDDICDTPSTLLPGCSNRRCPRPAERWGRFLLTSVPVHCTPCVDIPAWQPTASWHPHEYATGKVARRLWWLAEGELRLGRVVPEIGDPRHVDFCLPLCWHLEELPWNPLVISFGQALLPSFCQ